MVSTIAEVVGAVKEDLKNLPRINSKVDWDKQALENLSEDNSAGAGIEKDWILFISNKRRSGWKN